MKISSLIFAFTSLLLVNASPAKRDICSGETVLGETYIGEEKNVKLQYITCPNVPTVTKRALEPRQTNVCGRTCATSCFTPSGGGPDPNDCHVIADALRFDSQNIGPLFTIGHGTNNTVALFYQSCETFFVNQDPVDEIYCRTDWASLVDFIAPNCQATQNAHGGKCVASDQQWFAQVQHS